MHSIRMKITAMTIAAILTSLLTFIVIGFFTLGKENDQNSVEKMNLLSQNAAQTADARLHSLKTAVDITAHIAEHSLDTVNLKNYGVSLASLAKTLAGSAAGFRQCRRLYQRYRQLLLLYQPGDRHIGTGFFLFKDRQAVFCKKRFDDFRPA